MLRQDQWIGLFIIRIQAQQLASYKLSTTTQCPGGAHAVVGRGERVGAWGVEPATSF